MIPIDLFIAACFIVTILCGHEYGWACVCHGTYVLGRADLWCQSSLSHQRNTGITDTCYHAQISVDSGDSVRSPCF